MMILFFLGQDIVNYDVEVGILMLEDILNLHTDFLALV